MPAHKVVHRVWLVKTANLCGGGERGSATSVDGAVTCKKCIKEMRKRDLAVPPKTENESNR